VNKNEQPIGVFDSGIGGLTVLKALKARLPSESFLYLGDTARLPYGIKSKQTVANYALQAAKFLVDCEIKMLIIACNTASAMALSFLKQQFSSIPIIGVIEPGAQAACDASKTGHIVVAATEATIANQAYTHAIHCLMPTAKITGQACSLFVTLAEEGWLDDEITALVAGRYLLPHFNHQDTQADCLLLGCTHFPALIPTLHKVLGDRITIVDSAKTTANAVARVLDLQQICATNQKSGAIKYYLTDISPRFASIAAYFLQQPIDVSNLQLVDILKN